MDHILEKAYRESYLPFLDAFEEVDGIKLNLHISGYLLEWLVREKPYYIERLKKHIQSKRVEILAGGMYEPVLAMIPVEDGIGQIKMHRKFLKEIFSVDASGMWVAERVYEPHIPEIVAKAGISYIVLDDHHFKAIGLMEKELYGHYLTEFENYKIAIFPGLQFLRYALPFKQINEIDKYFRSVEKEGGKLVVFADDGEKFGLWPGTYNHVYKNGWLKNFFSYLFENSNWLNTVTFGEYLAKNRPLGLIYLNCNSYKEMDEWCLPATRIKDYQEFSNNSAQNYHPFIEGGYYKYFLVKYDESNDMHKKMLRVSKLARKREVAKKALYRGQCNDAYWHGVFGGLYLPHLRSEIYKNLIEAEKAVEKKTSPDAYFEDINLDGWEEVVINTRNIKAYFLLKEGGVMYELDYKPCNVNLIATLRRRYEAYHEKIKEAIPRQEVDGTKTIHDLLLKKESGLENFLHYDWYRRACLIDHILGQDATFESFFKCQYYEPGDFVKEPYQGKIEKKKDKVTLRLIRHGNFWRDSYSIPLIIEKLLKVDSVGDKILISYSISGEVKEKFFLGVEFNFSFLGLGGERFMEVGKEKYPLSKRGIMEPSTFVKFHDPYQGVDILMVMDEPKEIWTHPVEVVSLSEEGFERNYQSTMLMPLWEIDLKDGEKSFQIELKINGLCYNNDLQ
ncbi:MAG: DUF1926 domain-containing protein [Deltaproteobacteria bacterium]|nr:DUF1926 domain-containing protein [Deltaproteobacteria bacterium]